MLNKRVRAASNNPQLGGRTEKNRQGISSQTGHTYKKSAAQIVNREFSLFSRCQFLNLLTSCYSKISANLKLKPDLKLESN
eukprot:1253549-Amphidinium_carterae.1